jgi:hypothetical protein
LRRGGAFAGPALQDNWLHPAAWHAGNIEITQWNQAKD